MMRPTRGAMEISQATPQQLRCGDTVSLSATGASSHGPYYIHECMPGVMALAPAHNALLR